MCSLFFLTLLKSSATTQAEPLSANMLSLFGLLGGKRKIANGEAKSEESKPSAPVVGGYQSLLHENEELKARLDEEKNRTSAVKDELGELHTLYDHTVREELSLRKLVTSSMDYALENLADPLNLPVYIYGVVSLPSSFDCRIQNELQRVVRDPSFYPFTVDQSSGERTVDKESLTLRHISLKYGNVARDAVLRAKEELLEHNASGHYPVPCLFNKDSTVMNIEQLVKRIGEDVVNLHITHMEHLEILKENGDRLETLRQEIEKKNTIINELNNKANNLGGVVGNLRKRLREYEPSPQGGGEGDDDNNSKPKSKKRSKARISSQPAATDD